MTCDSDRFFVTPNGYGLHRPDGAPLVLLIDPRPLFANCLLAGLQSADDITQFRTFQSVSDLQVSECPPSCLVLLSIPNRVGGGVQAEADASIALLRGCEPALAFAILADSEEAGCVLRCLGQGARGYIPTSLPVQVVVQALRFIYAGGTFVPAASLARLAAQPMKPTSPALLHKKAFSPKETSVAQALRKGTPNKVIAYDLGICESTVKVHVRSIMKKLKARNRTEVAYLVEKASEGIDQAALR